jgi:molecular chaperone GrpE
VTEQQHPADRTEEAVGQAQSGSTAPADDRPTVRDAELEAEQDAVAGQAPSGDPVTPEVTPQGTGDASGQAAGEVSGQATGEASGEAPADLPDGQHPDSVVAAERLADLQRLQAEYVNYKRRVDRDRAVVQERAAQSVIEALLPVLDDIHAAREHGDLADGPFASIADKLESTLGKFGLQRYGAVGEEFDPGQHEALMHTAWPADGSVAAAQSTTVVQVLQPGYRAGEQVLRAARVAVADPE